MVAFLIKEKENDYVEMEFAKLLQNSNVKINPKQLGEIIPEKIQWHNSVVILTKEVLPKL